MIYNEKGIIFHAIVRSEQCYLHFAFLHFTPEFSDINAGKSSEQDHESSSGMHQGHTDRDDEVLTGATQCQSTTQGRANEGLP